MSDLLRIEYIPLSKVLRWNRNPKKHDLGAIAESIERHGFVDPPKWDGTLNEGKGGLVYGNGRDEALEWMKAQGRPLPRGVAYSEALDEWCMPVVFGVDAKSQAAAEALAIDHNNLVLSGGDYTAVDMARLWEGAEYTGLLSDLASLGELPLTVDGDDLDLLLSLGEVEPSGGGDDFDATPDDGPTRTAVGDLYVIGGVHRLIVGDCTDPAVVERLMGGSAASCVFSDLPYNVSYQAGESIESLKARNRRTDGKIVENDDDPAIAILGFRHMLEVSEPGAGIYICFPAEQPQSLAAMWEEPAYLQSMIVWLKDRMVMGRKDHHYQHEPLWYGWKLGAAHRWYGGYKQTTVWEIDRPFDSEDHPTEKPIALPQRAIENSSKRGDVVVDFFSGTGSTLTAAHRTGRRAYLCEIAPKYADVILRRAEAEGLTVELLQDG